jgi:hypothetical protein
MTFRTGRSPPHANHVTERGRRLIETALEASRRAYGKAQAAGDREALATAGRACCGDG